MLIFFSVNNDWIKKNLPIGEQRLISGRLERFQDIWQIVHPDYILCLENQEQLPKIEPIYPLTAGLNKKTFLKAIKHAQNMLIDLPEWQDSSFIKTQNFPKWKNALLQMHTPESIQNFTPNYPSRQRLAYDELLANQLALALLRKNRNNNKGQSITSKGKLQDECLKNLPFKLTNSQQKAISEIKKDMHSNHRMLRLLQGDVGSGKTIVALMSMLTAVEAGKQAVIMAPTEILAQQHMQSFLPLCEAIGITTDLLTGRHKGKKRQNILEKISSGITQIVIGTHALFQDSVIFSNLGLAVIDEQHRFGVHQRMSLSEKGEKIDNLVMTATPIPRTLTLAIYGDMSVSQLTEKPVGRKPIQTRLMPLERVEDIIQGLQRALDNKEQVYWVCPLVTESAFITLSPAEERAKELQEIYGNKVGLIHGQMKSKQQDEIMEQFQKNEIQILVATTIIEVGVNVPNASIMIIENAERFGLAQIHQLRGRIGRGTKQSSCILLYRTPLSEMSTKRLKTLKETEDGFLIAEQDLKLRGSGEVLGTKQSGLPDFKIADLEAHADFLPIIYDEVKHILHDDPKLTSKRGKALRILLYLFRRDEAINYLDAG